MEVLLDLDLALLRDFFRAFFVNPKARMWREFLAWFSLFSSSSPPPFFFGQDVARDSRLVFSLCFFFPPPFFLPRLLRSPHGQDVAQVLKKYSV
jgi:hypothetical protein